MAAEEPTRRKEGTSQGPQDPPRVVPIGPPKVPPTIPPTIQPIGPPKLQPVVPPTIQPVGPPKVQPVAPPKVQPVSPPRVQPVAPPTLQPMAPPRIQPVAPQVVQPTVVPVQPPRVQPTVAPTVQPVQPPRVQPVPAAPAPMPVAAAPPPPAAPPPANAASRMERQTRASDRVAGHTGLPLGVTLAILVLLLSAAAAAVAWQMARTAADGVLKGVDELGVATARLLATPEADWWDQEHGTVAGAKELLLAKIKEQESSLKDIDDQDARNAKATILREFRTRVEDLFAAATPGDAAQITRNKDRLKSMAGDPILGVDIYNAQRQPRGIGTRMPGGAATSKIGDTEVFAFTHESDGQQVRARLFLHPIKGREVGASGNFAAAGYAGVALSAESAYDAMDEARARALQVLAVVGGAGLLAAFVVLVPLLSLRQVLRDAEEFSRGNFDHRPTSAGSGEIGAVARAVARTALAARDRENDALAKAVAAVPPPTDHRADVEPALKPGPVLRIPGWEAEGTSRPCFEIAGDFFDYCPVKGAGFAVILVETSLRGLPAAFAASEVRALFRGAAPAFESPGSLLGFLGAEAGARLPAGHSVTATCAYVEPTSGRTLLARAGGGNAPVIWRAADRALEEIAVTGAPLSREGGPGTGASDPVDVSVDLAARDRLSFFSDGLRRARNSRKEKFGEERLGGLILKFGPMNSTAFVNMVLNDVDLFHEGAQQKDDLTVLTVRRLK